MLSYYFVIYIILFVSSVAGLFYSIALACIAHFHTSPEASEKILSNLLVIGLTYIALANVLSSQNGLYAIADLLQR